MSCFTNRGNNSGSVYFQFPFFHYQSEFQGEPIDPAEHFHYFMILYMLKSNAAQSFYKIAVGFIAKQRNVTENIVEHIGFFDIVELMHFTQPGCCAEFFL